MTDYLSYTNHGVAKYVAAVPPTDSIVGAQFHDLYVDDVTGINYHCIDDTFGAQQWLGTDGNTVPLRITAFNHPNLVAAYTMDNVSGSTLIDETPNGNDTTLSGGPIQVAGILDNCLEFDGIDDQGTLPLPVRSIFDFANDWTVSAWVYWDGATSSAFIASTKANQHFIARVFYISGTGTVNHLYYISPTGTYVPGPPVSSSGWHHIVVVREGTNLTIYTNNVAGTPGTAYPSGYSSNEFLAGFCRYASTFDPGKLDHVRFFNIAITPSDVAKLYNEVDAAAILAFDHPDLITAYTMDNISGSTLVNETGNVAYDGTIVNTNTIVGHVGNALEADVSGDHVQIDGLATRTDTSGAFCFWHYYEAGVTTYALSLAQSTNDNNYMNLFGQVTTWQIGAPAIQININGITKNDLHCSTESMIENSWNFVVIESTGSAYKITVNDVEQDLTFRQGTNDGKWIGNVTHNSAALFKLPRLSSAYTTGKLDQIRLFNRSLTVPEKTALYNGGIGA